MSDIFICDICHAPMKLIQRLSNHKGHGGKEFRRRRFGCTVCDYQTTIFAGGEGDLEYFPQAAIDELKAIAKQEEENRELWRE